jgi:CRISPR-associated protein Cas1
MKKLLNSLFVTSPDAYLGLDGECVSVKANNAEMRRLPLLGLESIVSFGRAGASPALMYKCAELGVNLSFCNEYGRFLASVSGEPKGNVLLRRMQFRLADNADVSLDLSRSFIIGKILNSRNILLRACRDHGGKINEPALRSAAEKLKWNLSAIQKAAAPDELRGIEGDAAKIYFSVFDELIVSQKDDFKFDGRNRRPPRDKVNALMSFVYTMLANDVRGALSAVGLDPYVGFFHTDRAGRASLALDMIEELRSAFADRIVLSLVNNRQISARDFEIKDDGTVLLDKDSKKIVLEVIHNKKKEEITHPFLGDKIPWGLVPYAQSMLIARFIRGDLDAYPPFVLK